MGALPPDRGAARGSETPVWAVAGDEVARRLAVDPASGLSDDEAERRLRAHGPNRLREVRPPAAWRILARQFASPIVALLGVAAAVAFGFDEWLDGTAILAVLALNSLIGFVSEYRAVQSVEALRELGDVRARARRGGRVVELSALRLVPGDVLLLEAGDVVTADLRLLVASKLEADESALTGESFPSPKSPEPVAEDAPLADRSGMLFKGTSVTRGSAEGLVVSTGMGSELGRIARLVQEAQKEVTPLEKRLASLGGRLVWVALGIAAVTTLLGLAGGGALFLMLETGIALAVAAVPEGLPIVATIALARGMWRMARRNALVHRLSAVETLGATTVIFTDKTGTLTENRMEVRRLELEGRSVRLAGDGALRFLEGPEGERALDPTRDPALSALVEAAVLCNNATLGEGGDGDPQGIGDPMEVALLRLGAAAGVRREALLEALPEVREEAFDPAQLSMATVHRVSAGDAERHRIAVKGAAEAVLASCTAVLSADGSERPLDAREREAWLRRSHELAAEGLRVLALARRETRASDASHREELTLLGLLGLADPPRQGVAPAIAACHEAGIRVVMVTGDHAGTAASVARAVGLVHEADPTVVQGRELAGADGSLAPQLASASIFARVTPEQKLELIAAYQRLGHVVAMTGDGVNDAPALRKADIGVAMGERGTQVAREAADMVLTDDSFASIVAAIEQGRVIFDNIRKFVFYLLSCNVSEVMVVSFAALAGLPLPLLPLQILYLNLVTDVFPALALAFGEGEPRVLRRPPRDPGQPLLTRAGWIAVGAYGLVMSACVLAAMLLAIEWLDCSREGAVTISFLTLALAQLWHVFDTRARGTGVLRNEVTRNPWVWGALLLCLGLMLVAVTLPGLRAVLGTSAPDPAGWGLVATLSLVPLLVGQLWLTLSGPRRPR